MNIYSSISSTVTPKHNDKNWSVENITKNNSNSNEQKIELDDTSGNDNNKHQTKNSTNTTNNSR